MFVLRKEIVSSLGRLVVNRIRIPIAANRKCQHSNCTMHSFLVAPSSGTLGKFLIAKFALKPFLAVQQHVLAQRFFRCEFTRFAQGATVQADAFVDNVYVLFQLEALVVGAIALVAFMLLHVRVSFRMVRQFAL